MDRDFKNALLLGIGTCLTASAFTLMPILSAKTIIQVTHVDAWATWGIGIIAVTSFLWSYPSGLVMDYFPKRAIFYLAYACVVLGGLLIGAALWFGSVTLLLLGFLSFGIGETLDKERVLAVELAQGGDPTFWQARVYAGRMFGFLIGPALVLIVLAAFANKLAFAWFVVPAALVLGIVAVAFMSMPRRRTVAELKAEHASRPTVPAHDSRTLQFFAAVFFGVGWAVMYPTMFVAPLVFARVFNFSATTSTALMGLHFLGMFLPALFAGRAARRFGRRRVIAAGAIIAGLSLLGLWAFALMPAAREALNLKLFMVSLFFLGIGPVTMLIASDVLFADSSTPHRRGRQSGLNYIMYSLLAAPVSFATGPLFAKYGFRVAVIEGFVLLLLAGIALACFRETRAGEYVLLARVPTRPVAPGIASGGAD
ncbi:MAG: MFS transporter [Thermoplasmatota archaeon]